MSLNRRKFLQYLSALPAVSGAPSVLAVPSQTLILPNEEHRSLKLRSLHTGERINVTYWEHGDYLLDGLAELYLLMRDHRENRIAPIDINLLDQLHSIQSKLNTTREIMLVSGYRSPETNGNLRNSEKGAGVAKRSLHMNGKAMDFRIPGLNLRHVHKATLASTLGGVGYYGRSGYIHMDTGRKRRWAL
ncbi:MAG: hypothetical protein ACJA0E_000074 [Bermanella sp.]|jgi:uncharacterized protein YcbK (DUF882 family)